MTNFKLINANEAVSMINDGAVVADIRDQNSFAAGHIPGAFFLNNDNVEAVLHELDFDTPIIVCCYHGISSQSAAAFLVERGFENVSSLNGGFEDWRVTQPDRVEI